MVQDRAAEDWDVGCGYGDGEKRMDELREQTLKLPRAPAHCNVGTGSGML